MLSIYRVAAGRSRARTPRSPGTGTHGLVTPKGPDPGSDSLTETNGHPALRVTDATKRFGGTLALNAVSLNVRPHSIAALVGPDGSGKSTLIKALAGYHRLDSGTIEVFGQPIDHQSDAGPDLRFVHQELALMPTLSIADNFASVNGYTRNRIGSIDWSVQYERVTEVLQQVSVFADPRTPVSDIGPVDRTLVAIARALHQMDVARGLLVLDEPTARLPLEQAMGLLGRLQSLRSQGLSVVYVTHRLQEVYEIADDVIVFGDGRSIHEGPLSDLPLERLQSLLAGARRPGGRETIKTLADDSIHDQRPVLEGRDLRSRRLNGVNLVVRAGEVIAVTGLIGSGRSELGRVVYGLQRREAGDILIEGKPASFPVADTLRMNAVGYVPQERSAGVLYTLTLGDNLTISSFNGLKSWFGLSRARFRQVAQRTIDSLGIVSGGVDALIENAVRREPAKGGSWQVASPAAVPADPR